MASVSSESQEATTSATTPAKAAEPKKAGKKDKKKAPAEDNTFVGRIADLEVSSADASAPKCSFRLKGKKSVAKQNFSIEVTDPILSAMLLQTALFSFANQIKVHVSAKPGNEDRLTVRSIKLQNH